MVQVGSDEKLLSNLGVNLIFFELGSQGLAFIFSLSLLAFESIWCLNSPLPLNLLPAGLVESDFESCQADEVLVLNVLDVVVGGGALVDEL